MTPTEKTIRDFCGRHADWWPSTTQVQEMLALAQPCPTCEALARTVMLDQTSHDTKRQWVGLTDKERSKIWRDVVKWGDPSHDEVDLMKAIETKLREKNGG